MKALSLIQPYATLIALGYKRNETRSFNTKHRGPLMIHASAGKPKWAREVCESDPIIKGILTKHGLTFDTLPRGVIVAVTRLLRPCRIVSKRSSPFDAYELTADQLSPTEYACGDYTHGRFAWPLIDVQVLPEPIPAKGSLGLWDAAKQIPGL